MTVWPPDAEHPHHCVRCSRVDLDGGQLRQETVDPKIEKEPIARNPPLCPLFCHTPWPRSRCHLQTREDTPPPLCPLFWRSEVVGDGIDIRGRGTKPDTADGLASRQSSGFRGFKENLIKTTIENKRLEFLHEAAHTSSIEPSWTLTTMSAVLPSKSRPT